MIKWIAVTVWLNCCRDTIPQSRETTETYGHNRFSFRVGTVGHEMSLINQKWLYGQVTHKPICTNVVRLCSLPETPLWAATCCSESQPSASLYRWAQTHLRGWQSLHTDKPPGWHHGWTHTAPERWTAGENYKVTQSPRCTYEPPNC